MSNLPPEPPDDDVVSPEAPANDESQNNAAASNVILLPGLGGAFVTSSADEPTAEGLVEPAADGTLQPPEPHLLEGAIEALLLVADGPVSEPSLDRWLGNPGPAVIRDGLYAIQDRMRRGYGGIRLVQVAKGWQLRTDVRFSPWVAAMRGGRAVKLSKAALEVLSIVAYRQPATRSEVEDLRGCDSGGVLRMLVDRQLVAVTGRKDAPGRPLLYGTTPEFLAMFSLRDLSDLPTLRDLRELRMDDGRDGLGQTADDDLDLDDDYDDDLELLDDEDGDDWDDDDDTLAPSVAPAPAPRRLHPGRTLPPDPGEWEDQDEPLADGEPAPITEAHDPEDSIGGAQGTLLSWRPPGSSATDPSPTDPADD